LHKHQTLSPQARLLILARLLLHKHLDLPQQVCYIVLDGVATIAQTSDFTSSGVRIALGQATSAQTSDFTATGRFIIGADSVIAQTSDMTASGGINFFGSATISQISSFSAVGGLKWNDITVPAETWTRSSRIWQRTWTEQTNPSTDWTTLGKQDAA
jgi:hypothetical protein